MPGKVDFKKTMDGYRAEPGEFRIVELPPLRYLMIDGHGDPNTAPEFATAVEALYSVAYKLKFASKRTLDRDYVVPPLEGLWWAADMDAFAGARDKSRWSWTMLNLVPDWVDDDTLAGAFEQAATKSARVGQVRAETLAEGRCVQTLHVGSFDEEAAVLQRMHTRFIPDHGLAMTGTHHEIYFSDPRKVAEAKRRTILRQPVTAAG